MQEIEYIECKKCGGQMPLLRKTKFGYDFCVNCSNVSPKSGVIVQRGPGEDTWNELVFTTERVTPSEEYAGVNSLEEDEIIE